MLLIIPLIPLSLLPFTSVPVAFIAPHQAFVAEMSMMWNLVVWCRILFYSSTLRWGLSPEQVRQICLKQVWFLKSKTNHSSLTEKWGYRYGNSNQDHLEGQEGPRTLQKNTPPVACFKVKVFYTRECSISVQHNHIKCCTIQICVFFPHFFLNSHDLKNTGAIWSKNINIPKKPKTMNMNVYSELFSVNCTQW